MLCLHLVQNLVIYFVPAGSRSLPADDCQMLARKDVFKVVACLRCLKIDFRAAFQAMMTAGLLNLEHEAVRNNTYRFGERLAQSSSGQGHYYLLSMLSHLQIADSFPHHCAEYYRLLTEIVRTISSMPAQVAHPSILFICNHMSAILHSSDLLHLCNRIPSPTSWVNCLLFHALSTLL